MTDVVQTMGPEQRARVLYMERLIAQGEPAHIETRHYFAHGVYAREITIPAGTVITGKIHRTEHIVTLSKGAITVVTPTGTKKLVAPCTFVAPAGAKECGWTDEECVWTVYHAVGEERDLAVIEAAYIAPSFEALDADTTQVLT